MPHQRAAFVAVKALMARCCGAGLMLAVCEGCQNDWSVLGICQTCRSMVPLQPAAEVARRRASNPQIMEPCRSMIDSSKIKAV